MTQRISIVRWTRTQGQYVALLGPPEQFRTSSLKRHALGRGETVLVGERTEGYRLDWYALAYDSTDLEFEEARARAMATVAAENERRVAGKPSLVS